MEICENWNQLLKEWNCLISLPSLIHFSLFLFTPALPNGPDEEIKKEMTSWRAQGNAAIKSKMKQFLSCGVFDGLLGFPR